MEGSTGHVTRKPLTYLYEHLLELGITYERLKKCLDVRDDWGGMVHAFEYLTVLGSVEAMWPLEMR